MEGEECVEGGGGCRDGGEEVWGGGRRPQHTYHPNPPPCVPLFALQNQVELKGPIPKLPIGGDYDHIGFAAGGTGIAPALQVMHAALTASPRTKLTILYGSVSPDDVICKPELDALAARHPGRVKIVYTVDAAPPRSGWAGRVGYIDAALLKAELPPPGAPGNNIVCVCGPPPMMKSLSGETAKVDGKKVQGPLSGALKELGYAEKDVFKF